MCVLCNIMLYSSVAKVSIKSVFLKSGVMSKWKLRVSQGNLVLSHFPVP